MPHTQSIPASIPADLDDIDALDLFPFDEDVLLIQLTRQPLEPTAGRLDGTHSAEFNVTRANNVAISILRLGLLPTSLPTVIDSAFKENTRGGEMNDGDRVEHVARSFRTAAVELSDVDGASGATASLPSISWKVRCRGHCLYAVGKLFVGWDPCSDDEATFQGVAQAAEARSCVLSPISPLRVIHSNRPTSPVSSAQSGLFRTGQIKEPQRRPRIPNHIRISIGTKDYFVPKGGRGFSSEDLVSFLKDFSHDVLRILDFTRGKIMWQPKVEALLGYSVHDIPPTLSWWRRCIHSDDRERVWQSLSRSLNESSRSRFWSEEYRVRTRDGTYMTVVDQILICRDRDTGTPLTGFAAIFNPVQRSQIESALRINRSVLMNDIPHGKTSAAELRYQSQLVKTIADNAASGLFMMDAKGHPTFMNKAAERITGYKLEEIRHQPLHYAIHYKRPDGSHYPMEECPVDNSQAKLMSVSTQEEVFVDKFGRLFPVIWSCAPLEKDGRTVGAVIEFRDVTEEKKMEQERMAAQLEAEQQKIRAEETNVHKSRMSEFMDFICHEIRNPLHGIAANTEFLAELVTKKAKMRSSAGSASEQVDSAPPDDIVGETDDYMKDALLLIDGIRECVSHQSLITNNVLDLSRLEAGSVELDCMPLDVNDIVRQVVVMSRARLVEKNLRVEVYGLTVDDGGTDSATRDLPSLKGDATRLKQVFLNLVSNSIKFTDQGLITIRLNLLPNATRPHTALLAASVSDTGVGMTAEEMKSLFQRFTQTNKRISSHYGGSGLGLSICHELVRLFGGEIHVESTKGVGTTFYFTALMGLAEPVQLPPVAENKDVDAGLELLRKTAKAPHVVRVPTPVSSPKSLDKYRILIVEDNVINQKVMAGFMKRLSCPFSIAENGQEALRVLFGPSWADSDSSNDDAPQPPVKQNGCRNGRLKEFSLILMDMEMPVVNGRDCTRKIRSIERLLSGAEGNAEEKDSGSTRHSGIPIIAITGNATSAQMAEAWECGVDDYLTKPCSKESVARILEKWLSRITSFEKV